MILRFRRTLLLAAWLYLGTSASQVLHGADDLPGAGAEWWAFREVRRPPVPVTVTGGGAEHPIDAFVRVRLEGSELGPSPPADRGTLIRRLHYDLTGLPPTAEEIEAFAGDRRPDAYEQLADRLLGSPHFGERWARHWLDVGRFAETNGYERDAVKPNIWKYRDWVIEAFNADMPFDQFVLHQLAGDEIPGRDAQSVIATGILRAGTWNDEPNDPHHYKYERLDDMVDVVSTAFLGITVRCARCHDHKFDPIPQRDYYAFAAAFWAGAIEPRDRALMGGPTAEELGVDEVFGWTDLGADAPDLRILVNGDADQPGEVHGPGHLSLVPALHRPFAAPPAGAATTRRRTQLAGYITDRRNPLTARVMVNRIWQHLMGRGIVRTPNNFGVKGDEPSHRSLLDWLAADFMDGGWKMKRMVRQIILSKAYRQASVHPSEQEASARDPGNRLHWKMDRRRADAEVIRDAMLFASGEIDLRQGGPSFYPVLAPEVLEGFSRKGAAWTPSPEEERNRRSIYMMTKRHLFSPMMTAFDFPNSEKPCGKRDVTTVAPQALSLLNNDWVHARSEALATLVLAGTGEEDSAVRLAWRRALGRDPSPAEMEKAKRHLGKQAQLFANTGVSESASGGGPERRNPRFLAVASLCHVLLNTNEFIYVD